jgi:Peptidase C39 family
MKTRKGDEELEFMNATADTTIPCEKQYDPKSSRTCGAACLSTVYSSYGKDVAQAEIWQAIAKPNRFGSLSSTTHLMAMDALNRGFAGVAIQAHHPLQALRLCQQSGIRAILNHRLNQEVAAGHYSVLVSIDDKSVVLRDPFYGPSRRLSHAELLELWQPRFPSCEIAGNVVIGVGLQSPSVPACQLCHTPFPSNVECPKCKKPVGLRPVAVLGCMNGDCMARMWNFICCPSCDYMWTFSLQAPPPTATASRCSNGSSPPCRSAPSALDAEALSKEDPLNLNRLFGELDKFCGHILSLPAAANHPEIKQQLAFITASRETLTLALAEELARQKALKEQMAKRRQAAKEQQEAHRQRMEELSRPAPPLDGNALGYALLKNLGLGTLDQTTGSTSCRPLSGTYGNSKSSLNKVL